MKTRKHRGSSPFGIGADSNERSGIVSVHEELLAQLAAGEPPPSVIVIGVGDGNVLDDLARRLPATSVLALEPSAAGALQVLARPEVSNQVKQSRLVVLAGPDYAGATDAWKLFKKIAGMPPLFLDPALESACPVDVARAKVVAAQIVRGAIDNDRARRKFAGPYLINSLANLPVIAAEGDASALFGAFQGVPAVIVGAGPSLDRTIADVKALAGRVLIIAVDTAVRSLLAADIHPHLVVAVDPSPLNARHLDDLPDTRGMWFVAEGSLHPTVFRQFAGRTFTFKVSSHHPWPWLASQGAGRGTMQTWGSVLTTAFDLACRMGCNPIVFVGADLAYTDHLLYCRNTAYESDWAYLPTDKARADAFDREYFPNHQTCLQPDMQGVEVLSAPRFVQFRDWLVNRAHSATGQQIVNATGAGILYGGRIVQGDLASLRQVDGFGTRDAVHARLESAWNQSSQRRPAMLNRLSNGLGDPRNALPVGDWLAFAGDTIAAAQIDAGVRAATATIKTLRISSETLAERQHRMDRRIDGLGDAQRLSHGDYHHGSLQAPAQQAHIVLDFLQRTYVVEPGAGLLDVVSAASRMRSGMRMLDFGCGIGRSMEPLVKAGVQVDGVDMSERMIEFARANPALAGSQFFLGRGDDCGAAPDGAYDLIYSQACFRQIRSRATRNELLRCFARALRPGGTVVIWMPFYPGNVSSSIPAPQVPWDWDEHGGRRSSEEAEVWPTPDVLHLVYADYSRYFHDVRLQIVDMTPTGGDRQSAQLLVSASTSRTLSQRIHAPARPVVQPA